MSMVGKHLGIVCRAVIFFFCYGITTATTLVERCGGWRFGYVGFHNRVVSVAVNYRCYYCSHNSRRRQPQERKRITQPKNDDSENLCRPCPNRGSDTRTPSLEIRLGSHVCLGTMPVSTICCLFDCCIVEYGNFPLPTRRLFRTRRVSVIFPEITLQSSLAKIKGSNFGECNLNFHKMWSKDRISPEHRPGQTKSTSCDAIIQSEEPSVAPTLYY
jgi:hypothetical protein